MIDPTWNRRRLLKGVCLGGLACAVRGGASGCEAQARKPLIAITLDLEMSRNFPRWEDTHWDYEKGLLDEPAKQYALGAARRVKERGGVVHFFCVARVLEQPNIDWLKELHDQGHPIGNHTYDHVNVLARSPGDLQFRFQRAPWLIEGKSTLEVIRENVHLAKVALKERAGILNRGFRTPGGFNNGLKDREDIQGLLIDEGFTWVSSLYPPHDNSQPGEKPSRLVFDSIVKAQSLAQPFRYPGGLIEIPMSPISDIGAFRNGRWQLEDFLEAVRVAVQWTIENNAVFDFLAHPSCLGVVDPEFKSIDLICKLSENAGVAIIDLDTIARSVPAAS